MRLSLSSRLLFSTLMFSALFCFKVSAQADDISMSMQMSALPSPASGPEAPYLTENNLAMDRMMSAMSIEPSGDVDKDFVGMMVPHHQGAIEMAQAELRYGKNEQLKRLAQEIIVTQQQEIAAMRLALGQPLPPSAASPDQIPAIGH